MEFIPLAFTASDQSSLYSKQVGRHGAVVHHNRAKHEVLARAGLFVELEAARFVSKNKPISQ